MWSEWNKLLCILLSILWYLSVAFFINFIALAIFYFVTDGLFTSPAAIIILYLTNFNKDLFHYLPIRNFEDSATIINAYVWLVNPRPNLA